MTEDSRREPQPDPEAQARIMTVAAIEPEVFLPAVPANGPAPAAHKPYDLAELEELDPMRYWLTITERQVENYDKRIAELMEKVTPLTERRDALKRAIAAATQPLPAGRIVRRTKLDAGGKPEGEPRRSRPPKNPEAVERVKELLRAHPELKNGTIADRVGGGMSAGLVSYYRNHQ